MCISQSRCKSFQTRLALRFKHVRLAFYVFAMFSLHKSVLSLIIFSLFFDVGLLSVCRLFILRFSASRRIEIRTHIEKQFLYLSNISDSIVNCNLFRWHAVMQPMYPVGASLFVRHLVTATILVQWKRSKLYVGLLQNSSSSPLIWRNPVLLHSLGVTLLQAVELVA